MKTSRPYTDEFYYALVLLYTPRLGHTISKRIVRRMGSLHSFFTKPLGRLPQIEGLSSKKIKNIREENIRVLEKATQEYEYCIQNDIKIYVWHMPEYPNRLRQCYDAPFVFFTRGNVQFRENQRVVSIVGTREMTSHAREVCQQIVKDLVPYKPLIVSGLAYGVDITAHRAALENGLSTVAVLAHGFAQPVYPHSHQLVARDMQVDGGLISEFKRDTEIARQQFPQRNRIIAGLADVLIVVETKEKGGSMITAYLAHDYDREIFAVPGRLTDPLSRGCHQLIRRQIAHMFISVEHLAEVMNWDNQEHGAEDEPAEMPQSLFGANEEEASAVLPPEQKKIIEYLRTHGRTSLNDLSIGLDTPLHTLQPLLLELELGGHIKVLPGSLYEV